MSFTDDTEALSGLSALDRALEPGNRSSRRPEPAPGFMEIEIPVAVSFGRARVPLKDAMRLTSGSVVRLDRTAADPVDIMVNGTPVARGEVVEMNGNFAVRVTEVLRRPGGQAWNPE